MLEEEDKLLLAGLGRDERDAKEEDEIAESEFRILCGDPLEGFDEVKMSGFDEAPPELVALEDVTPQDVAPEDVKHDHSTGDQQKQDEMEMFREEMRMQKEEIKKLMEGLARERALVNNNTKKKKLNAAVHSSGDELSDVGETLQSTHLAVSP